MLAQARACRCSPALLRPSRGGLPLLATRRSVLRRFKPDDKPQGSERLPPKNGDDAAAAEASLLREPLPLLLAAGHDDGAPKALLPARTTRQHDDAAAAVQDHQQQHDADEEQQPEGLEGRREDSGAAHGDASPHAQAPTEQQQQQQQQQQEDEQQQLAATHDTPTLHTPLPPGAAGQEERPTPPDATAEPPPWQQLAQDQHQQHHHAQHEPAPSPAPSPPSSLSTILTTEELSAPPALADDAPPGQHSTANPALLDDSLAGLTNAPEPPHPEGPHPATPPITTDSIAAAVPPSPPITSTAEQAHPPHRSDEPAPAMAAEAAFPASGLRPVSAAAAPPPPPPQREPLAVGAAPRATPVAALSSSHEFPPAPPPPLAIPSAVQPPPHPQVFASAAPLNSSISGGGGDVPQQQQQHRQAAGDDGGRAAAAEAAAAVEQQRKQAEQQQKQAEQQQRQHEQHEQAVRAAAAAPPPGSPALGIGRATSVVLGLLRMATLAAAVALMLVPGPSFRWLLSGSHGVLPPGFTLPREVLLMLVAAGAGMLPVAQALFCLEETSHHQLMRSHTTAQLAWAVMVFGGAALLVTVQAVSLHTPRLVGICGVVASLAAVTGATVLRRVRAADAANLEEALQGKPPPNPIIKALRGLIGLVVACLSILVPRSLPSVFLSAASLFFFGVALVVAVPEAQALLYGRAAAPLIPPPPALAAPSAAELAQRLTGAALIFASRWLAAGLNAACTVAFAVKEVADKGLLARRLPRSLCGALSIASAVEAVVLSAATVVGIAPRNELVALAVGGFSLVALVCGYLAWASPDHTLWSAMWPWSSSSASPWGSRLPFGGFLPGGGVIGRPAQHPALYNLHRYPQQPSVLGGTAARLVAPGAAAAALTPLEQQAYLAGGMVTPPMAGALSPMGAAGQLPLMNPGGLVAPGVVPGAVLPGDPLTAAAAAAAAGGLQQAGAPPPVPLDGSPSKLDHYLDNAAFHTGMSSP